MNLKRVSILVLLLVMLNTVSIFMVYSAPIFYVGDRSPAYNGKVETMKVILRVEVLSNGKPYPFAFVHFFVDDEWVGYEISDSNGIARISAGTLDTLGYHNWKVRVDKQGFDSYWSSVWRFNYQPRPFLKLESKFGETFGECNYTYGTTASFGVVEPVISLGEGKRMIFDGWVSYQQNGYTGSISNGQVLMVNDIIEYAEWKTQYYLDMSCDLPQCVYPKSGWYDEGNRIGVRVVAIEGVEFHGWVGLGNESYTGNETYASIKMSGPVKQQALFLREDYSFNVMSAHGDVWGGGVYYAWDNVSFGLADSVVEAGEDSRWVFMGWSRDSKLGYKGNETSAQISLGGDITQTANWKKQHYVAVECGEGGNVTTQSGWFDEGSKIVLEARTLDGYKFIGWSGIGDSSYSGNGNNVTLAVYSPVSETASWKKQHKVNIDSELPATGRGIYLDGDSVTLEAKKVEGLIVRRIFKQWTGDICSTNNPFTFKINRDMEIATVYEKNYTIFLGLMGVVIIAVGAFFLRMIRQ